MKTPHNYTANTIVAIVILLMAWHMQANGRKNWGWVFFAGFTCHVWYRVPTNVNKKP